MPELEALIHAAFPASEARGCVQRHSAATLHFKDEGEQQPTFVVFDESEAHFTVCRESGDTLTIWKIDNCTLLGHESPGTGRCDIAVFDQKTILFAEIKDPKTKQRNAAKEEAFEQLIGTLHLVYSKPILQSALNSYTIDAVIALNFAKTWPARPSKSADKQRTFATLFGIELLEGNSYTFSPQPH